MVGVASGIPKGASAVPHKQLSDCRDLGRECLTGFGPTDHSLATTADGAVFTWRARVNAGCLGHREDLSDQLVLPKKIEAWSPTATPGQ